MKKLTVLVAILCVMASAAFAQVESFTYESDHYVVVSEISAEHAELTAMKLEAYMDLYNSFFHYDPAELPSKLNVRIFESKDRFDTHLRRAIGETRDDFVYLHYNDLSRSELVGFNKETGFDVSLVHQNFIQFFRAFIPNPPLWLREGFAVYFERAEYDPEFGYAVLRENLAWLETLKSIMAGEADVAPLDLEEILTIDVETARANIDVFYPMSWGMVSFLINADDSQNNRILWDTLSALSPTASMEENVTRIQREVLRWVNIDNVREDFFSYVDSTRSFRGLITAGISEYNNENLEEAEENFVTALNLRTDNYIPYYYLGLINYDEGNYQLAEYYYNQAIERGADEALASYALGVNAFAATRYDEAASFLQRAVELNPDRYQERAQQLLTRIQDA